MLNSSSKMKMRAPVSSLLVVMMLVFLSSCLPQGTAPAIQDSNSTTNNTNTNTNYTEPTFTTSGIFVQEGGVQSTTQFSLPLNFEDSFLVRG